MKKTIFLIFYCLLVIFTLKPITISAQSSTPNDGSKLFRREWANLGLGTSTDKVFKSIEGINISIDYHWMPKKITYQAGFNSTRKLNYGSSLNVLNAGIGKSVMNKTFLLCFIAGPGLMFGRNIHEENLEEEKFMTVGLTSKFEMIFKVIKNFGIGLELYTNVNSVQNTTGALIAIHLNNDR